MSSISKLSAPVGVVDIGSNSIRLVIYDGVKRAPSPIFNEKLLCGLARNMEVTGTLDPQGAQRALKCLGRFISLAELIGVRSLTLFATSAVRDAADGAEFVNQVQERYGQKVEVLSGEVEAHYAGLGICSSIINANGVIADLGGGSLELIGVNQGMLASGQGTSLPIGPLRLAGDKRKQSTFQKLVTNSLNHFDLPAFAKKASIYCVGGAFRSLAKIHMSRRHYPLKVIHNYSVDAQEFYTTLQLVASMSSGSLEDVPDVSKKRAKFLPFASIIGMEMIDRGQPKNIVFSTSGVREGLMFSILKDKERSKDPLIAGSIDMARNLPNGYTYGQELFAWIRPIIDRLRLNNDRLIMAACILSDIACFEHTEYRPQISFQRIMDSSLLGISHQERAFIAHILYCRYKPNADESLLDEPTLFLLSKAIRDKARTLGLAIRLGRSLSASFPHILPACQLSVTSSRLTLSCDKTLTNLMGEKVDKRLGQLADALHLQANVH